MDHATCPACSMALPNRAIFCPSCGTQARCKNCRDILEVGARVCVLCGVPIDAQSPATLDHNSHHPNIIKFEETRTSRQFEARLTNEAIEHIGGPLGAFLGARLPMGDSRAKGQGAPVIETEDVSQYDDRNVPSPSEAELSAIEATLTSPKVSSSEDSLLRLTFRIDHDHLRLDESRLKATSKSDAVRRLTYLSLLASEKLLNQEKSQRSDIIDIIKDAGLFDSNTAKVFAHTDELSIDGEQVGLRLPGREKAREFLSEVHNPNVPNQWQMGGATRSRSRTAKGGEAGESSTHPRRTTQTLSKKVAIYVAKWKEKGSSINVHTILAAEGRTQLDKAVVGLWAIRFAMGEEEAIIVSRGELAQFILEAFEIRLDDRSMERTLKKDKKYTSSAGGTKFRINPTGMGYARQLLGLPEISALDPQDMANYDASNQP